MNSTEKEKITVLLNWLSNKDSQFAILYGGTPELDKDYRFCSNDGDFTIDEIIELFELENNL